MKTFNKLFFIAGSIASLLINNVYASENTTKTDSETTTEKIQKERYYMVFIKSSIGLEKRDDTPVVNTPEFINNMVSEIHSLIIENKDTYVDTEKFEAIEETQKLRKRNNNKKRTEVEENDTVGSPYVYPISSVEDSTVLYAYLNENLVPEIEGIEYVSSVHIGEHFDINESKEPIYNIDEIKKYTGWKDVTVKDKKDYPQLSLISQGQYRSAYVDEYDNNYYYPSSAGEGINIIVLDTGFNFKSPEFSNTDEREVKCTVEIRNATSYDVADESICGTHIEPNYHGEIVSDMAGGINGGVAVKSNIYGVALDYSITDKLLEENIFAGVQYIIDNLVKPHKTIVNISSGKFYKISELSDSGYHYQMLVRQLIEKGAIVTASAGNQGIYTYNQVRDYQYFPCSINGVICVGGTEQFFPLMSNYDLTDFSNSGETVDVYAPFFVYADYRDVDGTDITANLAYGTSFSAPLAAGVAALVMAENKDVNFDSYSMTNYLSRIALKDIVGKLESDIDHNLYLNNGKNIVYSANGQYAGCGRLSGFSTCSNENFPICNEELGICLNDKGEYDYFGHVDIDPFDYSSTDIYETWSDYPSDWDDEDPERPSGLIGFVNGTPIYEWDDYTFGFNDFDNDYDDDYDEDYDPVRPSENYTPKPAEDNEEEGNQNIKPSVDYYEDDNEGGNNPVKPSGDYYEPDQPSKTIKNEPTVTPTETDKDKETTTPTKVNTNKEITTPAKTMTITSTTLKPIKNKTTKAVKQNTERVEQKSTKDSKQENSIKTKQVSTTTTKASIQIIRLTKATFNGIKIKTNKTTKQASTKTTTAIGGKDQKTNAKTTPTPIADHVRIVDTTGSLPVNLQDIFKSWTDRMKGYFKNLEIKNNNKN